MKEIEWPKGHRVTYQDRKGNTFIGTVDVHKRGWVMIDLDEATPTPGGWDATKVMVKSVDLKSLGT